MGLFDDITFSESFPLLPNDYPHEGWQTKDMSCAMCRYHIQSDGLVVDVRREKYAKDSSNYVCNTLSASPTLYTDEKTIQLSIQDGIVVNINLQPTEDTKRNEEWLPWDGELE